jgi:hypothetical protein
VAGRLVCRRLPIFGFVSLYFTQLTVIAWQYYNSVQAARRILKKIASVPCLAPTSAIWILRILGFDSDESQNTVDIAGHFL